MKRSLTIIAIVQAILGVRVIARMLRTGGGIRISRAVEPAAGRVSVLLPVLNEAARVRPCLDGLLAQGEEVAEILVIDGGSTDGTPRIVAEYAERDERLRLIEITPPIGDNGKAHGLSAGERASSSDWILTIDADVRPDPALARSLLDHAAAANIGALSVATWQWLSGAGEGLVHPSMLSTLIYRFGIPGSATCRANQVQANGQCFLIRRELLAKAGGFAGVTGEIAEDVALARAVARGGDLVGFYESDGLADVQMYETAGETWRNWSRSLPLRDRRNEVSGLLGLAEVALVQAAPLWLLPIAIAQSGWRSAAARLNVALLVTRIGVLNGSRRAYQAPPATYWASPLLDGPVTLQLIISYFRRRHTWRGRDILRGGAQ